jgi:hypothetical protein
MTLNLDERLPAASAPHHLHAVVEGVEILKETRQ